MAETPGSDSHHPQRTYVVALTGGIAAGKTAVSDRFARLGVPVIDTDRIAHALVAPGQPLLDAVSAAFGPRVLDQEGHLDRRRLREIVFADPVQKKRLEALLHPAILAETQRRLRQVRDPYCLVVIPLLAEVGVADWIDRVLVVAVDEPTQLRRLVARDGVDETQARAALAAQASREQRLAIADDVITNDGPLADLDEAVSQLHQKYVELSR